MNLNKARTVFLKKNAIRSAKIFAFCFFIFSWLGEASSLGASIWATVFALFIGGGAAYLTWDDAVSDEEILQRINEQASISPLNWAPTTEASGEQQ